MINFTQEDIQTLKDAIVKFGTKPQLRQLQEECAELIVAINHCFRCRENAADEFLEEFVDVYIVMFQLYLAAKAPDDFEEMFRFKMSKILNRIQKEVKHD